MFYSTFGEVLKAEVNINKSVCLSRNLFTVSPIDRKANKQAPDSRAK